MKVKLHVVGGPYQGETFELFVTSGVKATIGRAPTNDVAFPATPTVSNTHAYIKNQNGVLVLLDSGSTNGIWVDGQRVTRWPLRNGGIVGLGRTGPQIQFFIDDMTAAQSATELPQTETCPLCTSPLDENAFTCFQCRRRMCATHYDPQAGVCRPCATRPVAPAAAPQAAAPYPQRAQPGGYGATPGYAGVPVDAGGATQEIGRACAICGSTEGQFFFNCPGCGRFQCNAHHDPRTGYCTGCAGG